MSLNPTHGTFKFWVPPEPQEQVCWSSPVITHCQFRQTFCRYYRKKRWCHTLHDAFMPHSCDSKQPPAVNLWCFYQIWQTCYHNTKGVHKVASIKHPASKTVSTHCTHNSCISLVLHPLKTNVSQPESRAMTTASTTVCLSQTEALHSA